MTKNLVFLHGFPFNRTSWSAEIGHFSDHRVLAPDLRGHGGGPEGPAPWFIHHYVEDLKKFLDEKSADRAILCGLSMGGYVALHFAEKYPERVEALVLANTQAGPDSNEAKDKRYQTVEKLHQDGLQAMAADMAKGMLAESTLRENPEVLGRVVAMIQGNKAENAAKVVGALAARRDATPFLKSLRCPTLVIAGDQDKVISPEAGRAMADAIPGAEFALLSGAGHLSNLEQPAAFQKRVREFLRKL